MLTHREKGSSRHKHLQRLGWIIASFVLITFYQNCDGTFSTQGEQASSSLKGGEGQAGLGDSGADGSGGSGSGTGTGTDTGAADTAGAEAAARAAEAERARIAECVSLMSKPSITSYSSTAATIKSGAGGNGAGDAAGTPIELVVNSGVTDLTKAAALNCNIATNMTCDIVSGDAARPSTLSKAIDDFGVDAALTAVAEVDRNNILGRAFNRGNNNCNGAVAADGTKRINTPTDRNNANNRVTYRCVEGSVWVRVIAQSQVNNQNRSANSDPLYIKVTLNDSCWNESRLKSVAAIPALAAYGSSVSIDGEWAATVAPNEGTSGGIASTGSLTIFHRVGSQWNFTQKIEIGDATANDTLTAVSISGSTLVVSSAKRGNKGAVFVYTLSGTTWSQTQQINPPENQDGQKFGASLDLNGSSLVVGAPNYSITDGANDRGGAVYTFNCVSGACTYKYMLKSADAGRAFGSSVALNGSSTFAVGAPQSLVTQSAGKGAVHVFNFSDGLLVKSLAPADGHVGMRFGDSVAISGNNLAVGAPLRNNAATTSSGAVYFYDNLTTASLKQTLVGAVLGGNLGQAVKFGASGLLVGCPFCGATNGGVVFFHKLTSLSAGVAADFRIFNLNQGANDGFGYSLGISGSDVVAGASTKTDPNNGSGAAFIYRMK